MKRTLTIMLAAALSLGAAAEEELVRLGEDIAMPKSTNAKVGQEELPCVAIQVPHSGGGYVSVSCGASHKVANEDAITKLQEAAARLGDKLVRFRVGNATFYGFYCKECGGYEGHAVAMGGFLALYVFPPKGRGLDAESLDILKKVVFVPQKGFGIDSAIKLYGPKSPMKASVKFSVLKKMVEARPECVELIALLWDVAKEAGETAAAAWCEAELKRLDPEVYGTPTTSIPMTDFTCEQGNKITGGVAIYQKFAKKTITIPTSGGGNAPATRTPNAKTKTVTLPGGVTMEMIYCPPGTFTMGSPENEPGRRSTYDVHQIKVTLTKGFRLGKYEVTSRQYKAVMGGKPAEGDDLPRCSVSWRDADAFCRKVGGGARLPTEAEWEYACRAGSTTAYPWGGSCNGVEANCDGTSPCGTEAKGPNLGHPVKGGSYKPNAWGFYDMNGNMREWCSDWRVLYDDDVANLTDPKGATEKESMVKVLRGGSYIDEAHRIRSAYRGFGDSRELVMANGFRMAMDE